MFARRRINKRLFKTQRQKFAFTKIEAEGGVEVVSAKDLTVGGSSPGLYCCVISLGNKLCGWK